MKKHQNALNYANVRASGGRKGRGSLENGWEEV